MADAGPAAVLTPLLGRPSDDETPAIDGNKTQRVSPFYTYRRVTRSLRSRRRRHLSHTWCLVLSAGVIAPEVLLPRAPLKGDQMSSGEVPFVSFH